ncbi:hypothetical protein HDU86_000396 [Geranomyces michiganensis]|nr:hypothetical protein HDU86_000396 [Geranomyces michiganensis]
MRLFFPHPTLNNIRATASCFHGRAPVKSPTGIHRRRFASATTLSPPPPPLFRTGTSGKKWEAVIGLEVHAQLSTATKLFSPALAAPSPSPNTRVSPIDAAFPGTLPLLNPRCVRLAVATALALSANVRLRSSFDRKHYFYGDSPQGYQITQVFDPIARGGMLKIGELDGIAYEKTVGITQLQIEQDSGKSLRADDGKTMLVDLNRAGVGVLEIVTEPHLRSADESVAFLKKLQRLLWHIGASAAEMDEGSWRCDVNISVRPLDGPLGIRTEIKHLMKFTSIKEAIDYEIDRQIALLESGRPVIAETRGFAVRTGQTTRLRSKEDAVDYRVFPDPDLPMLVLDAAEVQAIERSLPEALDTRRARLRSQHGLSTYQVAVMMDEPGAVEYFESVAEGREGKKAANWVIGELFGWLKMRNLRLRASPVDPARLGALMDLVEAGRLSGLRAKDALHLMVDGDARSPDAIAAANGWTQDNDAAALELLCDEIMGQHPETADKVRAGKTRLIKFFVGEVMKRTRGKSNPVIVATLVRKKLLGEQ